MVFAVVLLVTALPYTTAYQRDDGTADAPGASGRALSRDQPRRTGDDALVAPSLRATRLQSLINQSIASRARTIMVPRDVYEFSSANCAIVNATGLTIDGQGSSFIFAPTAGLRLQGCCNTTLRNFTIDIVPKAFTQGTVHFVAPPIRPVQPLLNQSAEIQVDLDAGYPLLSPIEDWIHAKVIFWDAQTLNLVPEQGGVRFIASINNRTNATRAVSPLSARRRVTVGIRPHVTNASKWWPVVGQRVSFPRVVGLGAVYQIGGRGGVVFEDINIYGSGNDAIHEYFGVGGTRYLRTSATRRPPGPLPGYFKGTLSGQILTAAQDPLQSANMGGLVTAETMRGPVVENSEYAYMGDDFMWVHTKLAVVWRINATTIRIVDPGSASRISNGGWGSSFKTFDLVSIRKTGTYFVRSVTVVTNPHDVAAAANVWNEMAARGVKPIAAVSSSWSLVDVIVEPDWVDGSPQTQPTDLVQIDSTEIVGAQVRGSWFHDGFCNGLRWKSSDSTIVNNRIEVNNGASLPFVLGVPCPRLLCGPLDAYNTTVESNIFVGGCVAVSPVVIRNVTNLVVRNNTHDADPLSSCDQSSPETLETCWG